MLHHTIITNRATAEATCPDCDGATRTKAIDGQLHRICRAACGWQGEALVAQTEAARAALVARGEGHLIGGRVA